MIRGGVEWRIPGCCVFFFLIDNVVGRPSGVHRGDKKNRYGAYVPCPFHADNNYKPPVRVLVNGKILYPQMAKVTYRAPVV